MRNNRPFILLIIVIVIAGFFQCKVKTTEEKDSQLTDKYRNVIGCSNYFQLKPSQGNNDVAISFCRKAFENEKETAEIKGVIVYKALSRDLLFVHVSYSYGQEHNRRGVNYLFSIDREKIIGFYEC
jgi:hypothetical protein